MVTIGHENRSVLKRDADGLFKPLLFENLIGQGGAVASERLSLYFSNTVDALVDFFNVFLLERGVSDFLEYFDKSVDDVQTGEIMKNIVP